MCIGNDMDIPIHSTSTVIYALITITVTGVMLLSPVLRQPSCCTGYESFGTGECSQVPLICRSPTEEELAQAAGLSVTIVRTSLAAQARRVAFTGDHISTAKGDGDQVSSPTYPERHFRALMRQMHCGPTAKQASREATGLSRAMCTASTFLHA